MKHERFVEGVVVALCVCSAIVIIVFTIIARYA